MKDDIKWSLFEILMKFGTVLILMLVVGWVSNKVVRPWLVREICARVVCK